MKKCMVCLLCLLLVLPALPLGAAAADKGAPVLESARMGILYEETTDTLLFDFNGDDQNVPASMTKVMTAVLVLEYDPTLSGTAIVSEAAVSDDYCDWKDDFYLKPGEDVKVKDLMNYLLIVSGNEAATVLAEYVAGTIPAFIKMMNNKAKELGMNDTAYYDPHGLSANNRITCKDMLILCRHAMKNETFREIVNSTSGTLPTNSQRKFVHKYKTTNRLKRHGNIAGYMTDYVDDILGIKTGSTNAAGLNFACCMKKDDLMFYSVVMHAGDVKYEGNTISGHFVDTVKLLDYARTYQKDGFAAGEQVGKLRTAGSLLTNLPVTAESDLYALTKDKVKVTLVAAEDLGKSVKKGDVVGKAMVEDAFGNTKEVNLLAAADAATSPLQYVVIAVILAAVAAGVVLVIRKRKKNATV